MIEPFLLRAGLAGLGVALAAAPIGCFVVWRRLAYFGDATSHAAVLGVALGLAVGMPVVAGVALAALAMALAVSETGRHRPGDTALGVASHGALALGLIALSLMPGQRVNLEAYLFGDVLAVTWADVGLVWAGALGLAGLLALRWRGLLLATLDADLAAAEGVDPDTERRVLTVALAVLVALALQIVGALLVTALLILPPAAARPLARDPEPMALIAVGIAALSVLGGLALSWEADTPAGPSVVAAALVCFVAAQAAGRLSGG